MVALVWWDWMAPFESVLPVTQKAIRPAAAPMNTFAVYCDRDDLNVSKRCAAERPTRQLQVSPPRRLAGCLQRVNRREQRSSRECYRLLPSCPVLHGG